MRRKQTFVELEEARTKVAELDGAGRPAYNVQVTSACVFLVAIGSMQRRYDRGLAPAMPRQKKRGGSVTFIEGLLRGVFRQKGRRRHDRRALARSNFGCSMEPRVNAIA